MDAACHELTLGSGVAALILHEWYRVRFETYLMRSQIRWIPFIDIELNEIAILAKEVFEGLRTFLGDYICAGFGKFIFQYRFSHSCLQLRGLTRHNSRRGRFHSLHLGNGKHHLGREKTVRLDQIMYLTGTKWIHQWHQNAFRLQMQECCEY